MNKPVFYIVFLFFTVQLKAQENLVPNGGFEEYNWCPSFAEGFYIDACKYWTSPTLATPDYLNSCSIDFDFSLNQYYFSVPENYVGYQHAQEGEAYALVYFSQNYLTQQTYSEYIQIKLSKQLEYGKFYKLKFYVHNPSDLICSNSIGALFTKDQMNLSIDSLIAQQPQFQSSKFNFFCDTNNWHEISYSFISSGEEQFLTMGVFTSLVNSDFTDFIGNQIVNDHVFSILYIDNVSLIENESKFPNVFTPNLDGVNDIIDFEIFYPSIENVTIFNRWGELVFTSEIDFKWNGKYNDENCLDGVYFFAIELKNREKKTGFIHLVR